ncbi:hypothetical protein EJ08DRAFT_647450 [Tothia fuscella]|uniref:Integral membrane protein n=1 Tax=Tothia fuscella TaxID=1048955 RepID=A0A9P4NXH8_9PEZI|nr:hypothetical protein EJ08DRAFT_647450 [Tothia fuscella]
MRSLISGNFGSSSFTSLSIILLSLSTYVTAQVGVLLDRAKAPACVFDCPTINAAQAVCIPPAVAPGTQATYQQCFCQSTYLATFRAGQSTGVCDGTCSAADNAKTQKWYMDLCKTGGAVVTPNNAAVVATATGTSTSSTSTSTSRTSSKTKNNHPTWLDEHYKWVIMVAILVVAAILAIVLGVWWKRRYNRKHRNYTRDTMLAAEDAKKSMQNKHPDAPSMSTVAIPNWDGSLLMSGANSREAMASRNVDNVTPVAAATGKKGRKAKFDSAVTETGVGSSYGDEERSVGFGRSGSSRLKKTRSKRSKLSDR